MVSTMPASRVGLVLLAIPVLTAARPATADDAVTMGEMIIEPPTLICLGFEWRIDGDDNHNAVGQVRYRRKGEADWHESLPLYRTGKGRSVSYGYGGHTKGNHKYLIPDALCGSILDLEPGTEYEVKLKAVDPDGVKREGAKTLQLKTRPEPEIPQGGEVRHVYPTGYEGKKEEPTYQSIMHAVNGVNPWCDCYQTMHPDRAKPGTVIKIHAGQYKIDRHYYREHDRNQTQRWLHGTILLTSDGTPEKPIAIVAAGDGEVIIDGADCDTLLNVMAADYLHFEGLTIRNTRIAFFGGLQGLQGCKGLTVKNCRLENIQYGVLAQDGRSERFYISDNTFIGCNDPNQFHPTAGENSGSTEAGYAVNLAGRGHVVCYNHAANFWDGINVFTSSLPDPEWGQQSRAIDFYNNHIDNICDNFIESDGGYCNIRVLRNRCFNCMGGPLSMQPVYAGPVYWIRNVVYNASGGFYGFKMPSVDNFLAYHNTLSNNHTWCGGGAGYIDIRNNAFMGPGKGSQTMYRPFSSPIGVGYKDPKSLFDYNAHRTVLTPDVPFQVRRGGPIEEVETFAGLAELGIEPHGMALPDYSGLFVNAEEPNHARNKTILYKPDAVDLRPAEGSPIIDAGCVIRGVNDGFAGTAPDMGAYEYGKPVPHYGPRTEKYRETR